MVATPHRAARRLRKAQKRRHAILSLVDRERLRNKLFRVTCSDSWTDHATSQSESAGFTPTTAKLLAKVAECGIYPPAGDLIHMGRCDSCGHIFPPAYLVTVFMFRICSDCAVRPSVSDLETYSVRDARYSVLMQILKNAQLNEPEIAALCHQWEGLSQRGIAALMNRSKTWVRQLLISANRKLAEAGITLPDSPRPSNRKPDLAFMDSRHLELTASRR